MLNCLLSAGEVPGLFSSEELSKELAALDSKRDKDAHYQVCVPPIASLLRLVSILVISSMCLVRTTCGYLSSMDAMPWPWHHQHVQLPSEHVTSAGLVCSRCVAGAAQQLCLFHSLPAAQPACGHQP